MRSSGTSCFFDELAHIVYQVPGLTQHNIHKQHTWYQEYVGGLEGRGKGMEYRNCRTWLGRQLLYQS